MTVAANINPLQARVVHGVHIAGCGTLFQTGQLYNPSGALWTAPVCGAHAARSYTVAYTLDDRQGFEAYPEEWSPLDGTTKGGGATIRIRATSAMVTLFGSEDSTIKKTRLAADLDYDTGVGERTVEVESTTGFTLPGVVNIGHEAVYCPNTGDGTHFGNADCERGLYAWQTDSRLDQPHACNFDVTGELPEYVSNRIVHWPGRRVTVFQWLCDETGYALDTAYKGTHEIEIWSGWLDTIEYEDTHFVLNCKSLAHGVLQREVGRDSVKAYVGHAGVSRILCTEEMMTLPRLKVDWNSTAGIGGLDIGSFRVTTDGQQTSATLTGWQTTTTVLQAIADTIAVAVNAQINTWGGADTIAGQGSSVRFYVDGEWSLRCRLLWYFTAGPTGGADVIIYHCEFGALGEAIGLSEIDVHYVVSATVDDNLAVEWTIPYVNHLAPTDSDIYCYADPEETGTFPSGPGLAKIEFESDAGTLAEIIYYATKTVVSADAGTFVLSGCQRGLCGTEALALAFPPGMGGDGPEIISAFGETSVLAGTALLRMLTSTGSGEYGSYDDWGSDAGLAVDPAAVDVSSFLLLDAEFANMRDLCFAKRMKFADFVGPNCLFHGYIFGGRTAPHIASGAMRFRLGITPVPVATKATDGLVLSDSQNGGLVGRPHFRSARTVINSIEVSSDWDPVTGEFRGNPTILTYANGRTRNPDGETASIEVEGMSGAPQEMAARYAGQRIFAVWGDARPLIELPVDRRALLASVGQMVRLTCTATLGPMGSRGLTSQPAVIISLTKRWFAPGEAPVSMVVCLLGEYGGLAPTFKVSAWNGGTTKATISDNVYTLNSDQVPWSGYAACKDWMYGPQTGQTYAVVAWTRGDYASRKSYLAAYDSDGIWVMTPVGAALPIAANTLIEFDVWGAANRHADQDLYVHIADSTPELAGGDPPFVWSP